MHHLSKLFAQFYNLSIISCLDLFSALATASSTNRFMSLKCSCRDISLMNTINRSGPSIDPWDNPDLIFNGSDFVLFISTNCSPFLR